MTYEFMTIANNINTINVKPILFFKTAAYLLYKPIAANNQSEPYINNLYFIQFKNVKHPNPKV